MESVVKQFIFPRNSRSQYLEPANQQLIEKRSHDRFAVSVDVIAYDPVANKSTDGRVTDLGFGGCFVESTKCFPQGTHLDLNLKCGERIFRCRALVTHVADRGMGLTFTEADPEQGISVTDWVRELSICRS